MTAAALKRWLDQMGWNADAAGVALDLSRSTIYAYLSATTPIPRSVQLACRALLTEHEHPAPPKAPAEPPGSMDPIYFPVANAVPKMSSIR